MKIIKREEEHCYKVQKELMVTGIFYSISHSFGMQWIY